MTTTDTETPDTSQPPADSPDAPDTPAPQAAIAAAAAPAPVDTETPSAGQVAPTPQEGTSARVLVPEKHGGLQGLVDEFRNAISPKQGRGVYIDPNTGERFVQHPNLTGKQQWLKVGAEALQGAGAGLVAGRGAGNKGAALAAGVKTQMASTAAADAQQDEQAATDYARQRQARADKANSQLLTTEIAKNEFALKRMQVTAGDDDIKFADSQEDREKTLGSADLGVYGDHFSLADVKKVRPEFWRDHYQDDAIRVIPNFNEKGERQGVHLYLRQPGVGDQVAPQGSPAYRFVQPTKPGESPHLETFTPSGTPTIRELDTYNAAAFAQQQQYQTTQNEAAFKGSETRKNTAQTAEAYAAAKKNNAEASAATASITPTDASGNVDLSKVSQQDLGIAKGIATGDLKMSDVFGRMKPEQRLYYTKLAQAIDPSFTSYNYPVRQKVAQDFSGNGADAVKNESYNIFLRHALNMSQVVNSMRNSQSPWLNTPLNKLVTEAAGNPEISNAIAPLLATRTEYLNLLNNNHALHEDDVQEGKKVLNENQSPAQMQGGLKSMVHTGAVRLDEQNNKYVTVFHRNAPGILSGPAAQAMSHFGLNDMARRLAPGAQAPAGAGAEVHDQATGRLTGHVVNNKFVPLQATQ